MNDEQLLRYSRQIMLPQIDVAGQEQLLAARVLIVGMGGLGSPAAMYLAGAGVGTLLLADHDQVELSNLQRQIAHGADDIGKSKVQSARETLRELNRDVETVPLERRLDVDELKQIVGDVDVVLDCTDNLDTRLAINQACRKHAVPVVSGAAIRMEAQLVVFDHRNADGPCYQCLYGGEGEQNLSCSENGVIAPLVGVIGALQALEAIKLITGVGRSDVCRLLLFDAVSLQWREMKLKRDPQCAVCGKA